MSQICPHKDKIRNKTVADEDENQRKSKRKSSSLEEHGSSSDLSKHKPKKKKNKGDVEVEQVKQQEDIQKQQTVHLSKHKPKKKKKKGEVEDQVKQLEDIQKQQTLELVNEAPSTYVSVADRLNPNRKGFDPEFKSKWAEMTKAERQVHVQKDKQHMKMQKTKTANIDFPFTANPDDHCETSPDAYRDIVPMLEHVAHQLGKSKAELSIYDPYFCAGAVKRHLASLGFPQVYNQCEDFYARLKGPGPPPHDVVVTNPPYGEEHVRRLLNFCISNGKPFCLLMPDYVAGKSFYLPSFTSSGGRKLLQAKDAQDDTSKTLPVYLFPKSRYVYWTPHGLREVKNKKSHRNLALGIRTSPFASFWYVSFAHVLDRTTLMKWWKQYIKKNPDAGGKLYDSIESLPITIEKS